MPAGNTDLSFLSRDVNGMPLNLASGPIPNMTSFSTLPGSGGKSSSKSSGFGAAGDIIGAVAPLLGSLFGGDNTARDKAATLTGESEGQFRGLYSEGGKLSAEGLKAIMAAVGGDPGALLAFAAPARKRVLDQYDTARKSLQFTPRGGGQATATAGLAASEASDLVATTSAERTTQLQHGEALLSAGINEKNAGATGLSNVIEQLTRQGDTKAQEQAGLGASIGNIVSTVLPFLAFL